MDANRPWGLELDPAGWWTMFAGTPPHLRIIAKLLRGTKPSSCSDERSFPNAEGA